MQRHGEGSRGPNVQYRCEAEKQSGRSVLDWTLIVVKFMTPGLWIWPPLPTGGDGKGYVPFDTEHNPGPQFLVQSVQGVVFILILYDEG